MPIPPNPPFVSLIPALIFLSGMAVLLFGIAVYAYSHLLAAQADDLAKLQREGVLSGDSEKDFEAVSFLLDSIAPAVTMRSEYWVITYFWIVRFLGLLGARDWMSLQMERLTGHQAMRYKTALDALNALRTF